MAKLLSGTRIYGTGTVDTQLFVSGTTSVSSTNSGALQVAGGVGVGGGAVFGGIVTATSFVGALTGNVTGTATTATNLAGGTANQYPYQTAPGITAFISTGSMYVGNAVTATNLAGGTTGAISYQTNPGATSFLALSGTAKSLLTAGASAPVYVTQVQAQSGTGSSSAATGQSLVVTGGGLGVTGDSYFGDNVGINSALNVNSGNANTGTALSNALYVAGGAWINKSLVVTDEAIFKGPVTFSGSATYILSTNTFYTDNILEIHTPPGGVYSNWNQDDLKDIGFRFHYYTAGTDTNAALVLDNNSKELHWYSSGAENATGDFSTATFGTFRSGIIKAVSGNQNSGNTNTGALQVLGGAGIAGSLFVAGAVTATTFFGAVTGVATTATNLVGGLAGSLPYQTAAGATSMLSIGTNGYVLTSNGTAPIWSAVSGLSAGLATTATNLAGGTVGQVPYQSAVGITSFYGPGTAGQILVSAGAGAPQYTNTGSIYVGDSAVSTNIRGGANGSLPYQSGSNATAFLSIGSAGSILTSNGTTPTYTSTASIYVNSAVNADNATYIKGGTAGQLVYQSSPGVTAFAGPGTAGQILVSAGTSAPVYTNTGSIYVNRSTLADLATTATSAATAYSTIGTLSTGTGFYGLSFNGSANQTWSLNTSTLMASAVQVVSSLSTGTGLYGGSFNGSSAQTWSLNTATLMTTAVNVAGGSQGSLHYQSAANTTAMLAIGTNGYVLTSNGTTPSWAPASGVTAGNATTATNLAGGLAGQFAYQTAPGLTSFASTGSMYVGGAVSSEKWSTARTVTFSGGDVTGSFSIDGSANVTGVALTVAADSVALGTDTTGNYVAAGATSGFGLSGSASAEAATFTVSANSTSSNTTNSIVYRDGSGNFSAGTISATLNGNALSATSATNISGGAAGSIPYNFGFGQTTFLAIGTNGYVMTSNGTAPTWTPLSGLSAGVATTATNLAGGTAGQVPYQTAAGLTSFYGPGTAGQILVSAGTSAPTYTNTASIGVGFVSNLLTAGTGLTGTAYNGSVAQTWTLNTATLMASAVTALSVPAANITGQLALANGGTAANLSAVNGGIVYSGASALAISAAGTLGQILISGGAGAPTWASTSTLYVNRAVTADSATGSAGSVANALTIGTGLTGTAGTYNGSAAVTVTLNTATYMTSSVSAGTANNLSGGGAGSIPYQTGAGATSMLSLGTNGYVLTAGASAPAWTAISGLSAGTATTATNIAGGTAGQIHYQTAPGSTGFAGPGTAGQFLQSTGASAPSYVGTSTMYVARAALADSATAATNATNVSSVTSLDDRIKAPADESASTMRFGFTSWTNNNNAPYADYLHLRSYTDATGGNDNLVMFRKDAIGMRIWQQSWGSATAYATYKDVAFTDSSITGSASQILTQAQPTAGVNYLTFVNANNASATAMTVYTTSSLFVNPGTQYVGMGAAVTPLARLHVVGAGVASLGSKRGGTSSGVFIEHNNNTDMYLELANSASYGSGILFAKGSATGNYGLLNYNNSTDAMTFYTAATQRVSIDSSGNVMIGSGTAGAPLAFTDATGLKIQLNANAANYYAIEKQAAVNSGDSLFKYNAGQTSAGEHGFYSGGSLKFLIDANGKVGINRTAPAARFHVVGVGSATSEVVARFAKGNYSDTGGHTCLIGLNNEPATWSKVAIGATRTSSYDTGYFGIYVSSDSASAADINTATDVRAKFSTSGLELANGLGVGTAPSGTNGEIRATNEITAYYSDRRLKENVKVIDNAVEKVLSLNGITYTPNEVAESFGYDRTIKLVGLFADEVEAILPEATRPAPFDQDENGNSKSGENYKTIQYEKLVPLLIEAIKEQQKQIAQLSEIVNTLANK